ncbi:MAG: hypothetical protein GY821_09450, partial [Gammaproteobacteria bacterium]|nr:hypothetical protein [Gammaproteobacteria bacterium]
MEKLLVFVPGLSLLGYCTALARYCRFNIETTPFFVVPSIISLLYIAAMFGVLQGAANTLLVIGSGFLLLSPLYLYRHGEKIFRDYFVTGFVVSIGFIIIFSLIAHQMPFRAWCLTTIIIPYGRHAQLTHFRAHQTKEIVLDLRHNILLFLVFFCSIFG